MQYHANKLLIRVLGEETKLAAKTAGCLNTASTLAKLGKLCTHRTHNLTSKNDVWCTRKHTPTLHFDLKMVKT